MVLKLFQRLITEDKKFENDVNMYGTQASSNDRHKSVRFENDVNMYGTQANGNIGVTSTQFENDVNMYGTQAHLVKK